MQKAIEHSADGGNVTEQFARVFEGTIGSQKRVETLQAAHNNFEQILSGCVGACACRSHR